MKFSTPRIYAVLMTGLLILVFLTCPLEGTAATAKQAYLSADSSYKTLRHSKARQKKSFEWLRCIWKYENIHKDFPTSAWAPAGMYKAAELYITLSRLSGKKTYLEQAKDLLHRIGHRYPESAYTPKAKRLLKKTGAPSRVHTAAKPVKKLLSKKRLTRNDRAIKKYMAGLKAKSSQKADAKTSHPVKKPSPPPCSGRRCTGDFQNEKQNHRGYPGYGSQILVKS